jgi:hypothetical protein
VYTLCKSVGRISNAKDEPHLPKSKVEDVGSRVVAHRGTATTKVKAKRKLLAHAELALRPPGEQWREDQIRSQNNSLFSGAATSRSAYLLQVANVDDVWAFLLDVQHIKVQVARFVAKVSYRMQIQGELKHS